MGPPVAGVAPRERPDLEQLRLVFNRFDANGDGIINLNDLQYAFRHIYDRELLKPVRQDRLSSAPTAMQRDDECAPT